jgi:amino acid transporter
MLTIAISVAAGCDAIFSFVPPGGQPWKMAAEVGVTAWLILRNLRGAKESVYVLTPIFLTFIVTHVGLITYGVLRHAGDLGRVLPATVQDTHAAVGELGGIGVAIILLRAFSLGGGTYTGIEAVSNGVSILREPRVENGKRTMLYMAGSLAFTAGGILLCYLLNAVQFTQGQTLNASLWNLLTQGWQVGGASVSVPVVGITLISEGLLLFVAARARWPRWRWTTGCRGGSRTCPNGSSPSTACSRWDSRPWRSCSTPAAMSACWWSCTRSTCSSRSR